MIHKRDALAALNETKAERNRIGNTIAEQAAAMIEHFFEGGDTMDHHSARIAATMLLLAGTALQGALRVAKEAGEPEEIPEWMKEGL